MNFMFFPPDFRAWKKVPLSTAVSSAGPDNFTYAGTFSEDVQIYAFARTLSYMSAEEGGRKSNKLWTCARAVDVHLNVLFEKDICLAYLRLSILITS
jgi:hypothetical protein